MFPTFLSHKCLQNERDRIHVGCCVLQRLFSNLSAASHMWRVVQQIGVADTKKGVKMWSSYGKQPPMSIINNNFARK